MEKYLIDTNILLRSVDPQSKQHSTAVGTIDLIFRQGDQCCITAQNLIEFWTVATRPVEVNGLGWDSTTTATTINEIKEQLELLPETPEILQYWFNLVTTYQIKGKRTHDTRLLAVMQTHEICHLLTFNIKDFISIPGINLIDPATFLKRN
jgi:predicted nucleic acid-binding protein